MWCVVEAIISNLIWEMLREYGKDLAYFIFYVVSLTYIMVLRYKEQSHMLEVISDLVASDNELRSEIRHCMDHSNLILSACIQSISGNDENARVILRTLITPKDREWDIKESD